MKTETVIVYAAIILATLFWGITFIWTEQVLKHYQPITTILLRLAISSVFLWSYGTISKRIQKIRKKDLSAVFMMTLFQPFLYFIGENYGVKIVGPTVTSVVIATIPLFTPFAAYFFLKEKITAMNLFGIMVSFVGVYFVIVDDQFRFIIPFDGAMVLIMAVAAAIAYSVIVIRLTDKYNIYSLITYQNTFGILFFLPVFLVFDYTDFVQTGFCSQAWLPLVELSLFGSTFAFILFTYGIKKIGISKTNVFSNIIPVFTAIAAYLLLGSRLTKLNIIGISIVVGGLFIAQINSSVFKATALLLAKPFRISRKKNRQKE